MARETRSWSFFVGLVAALASVCCTTAQTTSSTTTDGCVTDYDPSAEVDYFPIKAEIKYAETFDVEYFLSYKVVTVMASGVNTTYVLYQCGTPQPDMGDLEVQEYISIPVTKVATGTSSHVPRIEMLGEVSSIVAIAGDPSYIVSNCVEEGLADGSIIEAQSTDPVCGEVINNTMLMDAGVEVTFADSMYTSYCVNASEPLYKALAVYSYLETGPESGLAEGEVIKLFSVFYNQEERGNEVFTDIEDLWLCTKNNAQGCSLKLNDVPEVAWFPYVPTYEGTQDYASGWGAPRSDVYYTYAVDDAGGSLLLCDKSDTIELMTDEEMIACFGDASVCVFAANYTAVKDVMNQTALDQLSCVQNNRVFDITLSGVNAWFEAKSVEPHVMMVDMVVVLHGDEYDYGLSDYDRVLLREVATEEIESGTYYTDEPCVEDEAKDVLGQCEFILDFSTCDGVTADISPAPRTVPTATGAVWAVVATPLVLFLSSMV